MRFKSFKGFTLGKPKEPGEDPAGKSSPAEEITIMEAKMNGRARDLEDMTERIQKLASEPLASEEVGPHGPLEELSLTPENHTEEETADIFAPEEADAEPSDIKIVEMKMDEKPAEAPAPAADAGGLDLGGSLRGLFSEDEEEENPLANLIKSMPEYTTHEIVEDLNEIKRIIHEWERE
jgi:hypothetical protein